MTNEEATTLAEQHYKAFPEMGTRMSDVLALLYDNDALTDEDRDHLAEELEEAAMDEVCPPGTAVYNDPSTWDREPAAERTNP